MYRGLEISPINQVQNIDPALSSAVFCTSSQPLPPMEQLKNEFALMRRGVESTRERISDSFQLIEAIKVAKERGQLEPTAETNRNQIISAMFLRAVEYFGNTTLFVMEGRGYPGWHTRDSQPYLLKAAAARKQLLEEIGTFDQIFSDVPDDKLYEVVSAIMHDARCVVVGKPALDELQNRDNKAHLTGILAEYKVCTALQENGLPQATYSSPEDDLSNRKVDVVVPLSSEDDYLGIQVKGFLRHKGFNVRWKEAESIFWVTTPMHDTYSKFRLSPQHAGRLISRIGNAIAARALLASPEETELAAA